MTKKDIIKGNLEIAKWLSWEIIESKSNNYLWVNHEGKQYREDYLKFHVDSNWQWLCLEKIDNNTSDNLQSIICLLEDESSKFIKVNRLDLFKSIVNYIKRSNI